MKGGKEMILEVVYRQLREDFNYNGQLSVIHLPYIHKFEQEESKDKNAEIQPPSVIKLFDKSSNAKSLFQKLQPALKLLYEEFMDHKNVARLKTELRELKKTNFYFLEYRDFGLSFKNYLMQQKSRLQDKKLLNFSLQISKGLAQLQFVGINHRDIKVSNVILCDDDCLKIIDFDIAQTQRSTQSVKKGTFNRMTKCYACPSLIKAAKGECQYSETTVFRDDAYSFGLLMLQMILNKTPLQEAFDNFIKMEPNLRINQKKYQSIVKKFEKECSDLAKKHKSEILSQLIKLAFHLISYDSLKRIDLLSIYKYLKHIELNQTDKLVKYIQIEVKKASQRQYVEQDCEKAEESKGKSKVRRKMSDEVKKEYIFYPDHKDKGIRSVSRDNAKVATLNEKRNKLIMYDLQGNKKSIEINERTSTGTRVCATNEAAFIMGGEDQDTFSNCKTLNVCCNYADLKLQQKEKIPDDGRSSFAIAFSFDFNMIALAGGFTKNANLAKLILVYYPTLDKWNQNAKLLEKRISPSSCFTKENYYVFGGMIESDDDDVKYSSKIESFKGRSLRNMDGAIGIVVVVNKTPEFLKFIARADALAFHLQDEEVMILGGVNDEDNDLKEGYRIDFDGKEATQVQEPLRNTQTSFYSPGVNHRKKLYVADMYFEDAQLYIGTYQKDYSSINFESKNEQQ